MRKRIFFLWMLLLTLFLLTGCGYAGPEKAVRQEMELIRQLDESTIKAFVSYEDIRLLHSEPQAIGEETTEAVKLFFKNFKYRIRSSSLDKKEGTATVSLKITNLDAHLLAKDLCRAMIMASVSQEGAGNQEGLASSFSLMKTCLEENDYPLATTEATVHLREQDGTWVIEESAQLEDALAGGLVSYLQDPYLLSPEEVLRYTLLPFEDFTAQEWIHYLDFHDIFNTGSDLADELDQTLAEQLSAFFAYEITDVTQDGDNATAEVLVTSLDLQSVLNHCRQSLLDYAKTTESIRATDEELRQETAKYLLEALKSNQDSVQNSITVTLTNNGYTWEVLLDEVFSDALLGGVDMAVEILNPAAESEP